MIDSFEVKARATFNLQCIIDREGDDGGKRRTQDYLDTLIAEELRNATKECVTAQSWDAVRGIDKGFSSKLCTDRLMN